jgi:hypothetical protein
LLCQLSLFIVVVQKGVKKTEELQNLNGWMSWKSVLRKKVSFVKIGEGGKKWWVVVWIAPPVGFGLLFCQKKDSRVCHTTSTSVVR